jgi:hypothetical protein
MNLKTRKAEPLAGNGLQIGERLAGVLDKTNSQNHGAGQGKFGGRQ